MRPLSPRERQILEALWSLGPVSIREVMKHVARDIPDLAYSTIKTYIDRLERKGLVQRDATQFAHSFSTILSRDEFYAQEARALAELIGDSPLPIVRALVRRAKMSQSEIRELELLIASMDSGGGE